MSDQKSSFGASGAYSVSAPQLNPDHQSPVLAPGGAAPSNLVKDTTTSGFSTDVIQESRRQPVLVDFWAPWCGPCKQLTPALEKAVNAAGGTVKLVKMNIDEHPSIAGQLGIQSIPAVIAFKDGKPVDGFMGAVPETQIDEFIKRLGADSGKQAISEALIAAKEAKSAQDFDGAVQIYAAIVEQDAENIEAIAGLAELYFEAGDIGAAQAVLDAAPPKAADSPEIAAVRTRIALDAEAQALGDSSELERKLQLDEKDHQARLDLAMIQNARGERDAAADNLLAIVKSDRSWKDDGAKTQLLKLFEAWGPMDGATLAARRKLSSLLFS